MAVEPEQSRDRTEPTQNKVIGKGHKPVFTVNYDLRGNTISRQLGHWLRMKTRIMGNYDTGPGLISLVKLGMLHRFGKPLFRLRIWLRSQYALKSRLRGLVRKKRGYKR